jgi:hypothetical protein
MNFKRVSIENGLWPELLRQWEDECSSYEEDFSDYATASIPTLRPLAESAQVKKAGVYALCDESYYMALCQLNVAFLPGYDGKVLRVRHIVHSPRYDFDNDVAIEQYGDLLSRLFVGVFDASDGEMAAPYVKFHFKSPAERAFFAALQTALHGHSAFASVEMRGSWLYIKKNQ